MSEEQTTDAVEGTAETTAPEVPAGPVTDMSDEDLSSLLDSLVAEPEVGETPEEDEPGDTVADKPQQAGEQEDDKSKLENAAKGPDAKELQSVIDAQQAEIQKANRRLEQQELFIKRRSTEIGELRKERKELLAQIDAKIDEAVDAKDIYKLQRQREKAEEEIGQLDAQEQETAQIQADAQAIQKVLRPEEADMEAIAELLVADGVPASHVETFKKNPFAFKMGRADALIQLGKRSFERRVLVQVLGKYKEQKAELDKLKNKGNKVVKGVERALRQEASVNGAAGDSSSAEGRPSDVTQLSDDELDRFLAQSEG